MGLDLASMYADGITPNDFKDAVETGGNHGIACLINNYNFDPEHFPDGGHPFSLACELGQLEAAKELVQWGADIFEKEEECPTPMILAAQNGHYDVVRWLVGSGCDTDYYHEALDVYGDWEWGGSTLGEAIRNDHFEIAELLIDAGANLDDAIITGADGYFNNFDGAGKTYPIVELARSGNADLFKKAVKKGADCALHLDGVGPGFDGLTFLEFLIYFGHFELLEFLIPVYADINRVEDKTALYPIEFAALYENEKMVLHCLKLGARVVQEGTEHRFVFEAVVAGCPKCAEAITTAIADELSCVSESTRTLFLENVQRSSETIEKTKAKAINLLENILDGTMDDEPVAIDNALDQAAEALEELGKMDEYDELLNRAADYYTVILEKQASEIFG